MGEFSPIVSTGEIHIEHNLGKIPYFVGVFAKGDLKIDKNWWESAVILSDSSIWATGVSTNGVSKKNTKGAVVTVTETDFDIDFSVSSYVYSLRFKITDYLIIVVC